MGSSEECGVETGNWSFEWSASIGDNVDNPFLMGFIRVKDSSVPSWRKLELVDSFFKKKGQMFHE